MTNGNRGNILRANRLPHLALALLAVLLASLPGAQPAQADAPSSNARLESLYVEDTTLSPAFDSHTYDYLGFSDGSSTWTVGWRTPTATPSSSRGLGWTPTRTRPSSG